MNFASQLPTWATPIFEIADLALPFAEGKMNCVSCSFAVGDFRDGSEQREVYKPSLKCCTFHPDLSNFAVGLILAAGGVLPEGLLGNESSSLVLGIKAPESYKLSFAKSAFGTDNRLLCPYFDREQLNCGIWSCRPSPCVGFVCKSSLGLAGQSIWQQTETLLRGLEENLSYYCALELGYTDDDIESKTWVVSSAEKKQYYTECARLIKRLSPVTLRELAGEEFEQVRTKIQTLAREAQLC